MLKKIDFKSVLFILIGLLIFTQALFAFHNSNFEKKEFDGICNDIYTEKVWIDTCYLPYKQEDATLRFATIAEVVGILVAGTLVIIL